VVSEHERRRRLIGFFVAGTAATLLIQLPPSAVPAGQTRLPRDPSNIAQTLLAPAPPAVHTPSAAFPAGKAQPLLALPARLPSSLPAPLSFEVNAGQTDRAVKFVARGDGFSLFLTTEGAKLRLGQTGTVASRVLGLTLVGANRTLASRDWRRYLAKATIFSAVIPRSGARASRTTVG
jgi:hypothetical protein